MHSKDVDGAVEQIDAAIDAAREELDLLVSESYCVDSLPLLMMQRSARSAG